MRTKYLIPILAVSILIGSGINIAFAYTELSAPSSVPGQGQVPFLGPQALLDNFDTGTAVNAWNTTTGTFSKSAATVPPANEICAASYTNDPAIAYGGAGYSLKLDYNVSAENTFAGYYSLLGSASLASPVTYTAVSFYVRGAAGGEFFKIQIKNNSSTSYWDPDPNKPTHYYRNAASVYITDYLDGGVTTEWRKVTIPFKNFANLDGWTSMRELDIIFENAQSGINGSPAQGVIYIDNITFETDAVDIVRVDHFGDKLGTCALGGNIGTAVGGGALESLNKYSFSNISGEYPPDSYPYGMKLDYNVGAAGMWAATYIIFGGGYTDNTVEYPEQGGWIAIPQDFSAYNKLTYRMRAPAGTTVRLQIIDSSGTRATIIPGVSDNWVNYTTTLSSVPNLKKSSIKKIEFVLDYGWIDEYGGSKSGALFIDSVQFEK